MIRVILIFIAILGISCDEVTRVCGISKGNGTVFTESATIGDDGLLFSKAGKRYTQACENVKKLCDSLRQQQ